MQTVAFIAGLIIGGFAGAMLMLVYLSEDIENEYKKRIAGHKAAHTRKSKLYEIAKKIAWRGRNGTKKIV